MQKEIIEYKKKIRKIYSKKRIVQNRKYIIKLKKLAKDYGMPSNLLVAIFLIETNFRNKFIRIGEYIITLVYIGLNLLFKYPIKNYTIGMCQIGLASILEYNGRNIYKHVKYIDCVNINDLRNIIAAIDYKINFRICAKIVSGLHDRSMNINNKYILQLRYIGKEFNGRYSYGLLLEEIVCYLDEYY